MTSRDKGAANKRRAAVRLKQARGRKSSSTRWLTRQLNDPYVRAAQEAGYRSRAAFKLIDLAEKYDLLKPGHRVVDLGAAPGGWSQVAAARVGRAGRVVAADLVQFGGGGIFNDLGSVELSDVVIAQNQVRNTGSGICVGGGVYNRGGLVGAVRTRVTGNLTDCPNPGSIGIGSGLAIYSGGILLLTDSVVAGNGQAGSGAGIFGVNDAQMRLERTEVLNNDGAVDWAQGGGIQSQGELTVIDSRIAGNAVGWNGSGGGLWASGDSTITNTTFAQNRATTGGGIANLGTMTVTDSAILGNLVDGAGGGVLNSNGDLELTNVTVSGNAARPDALSSIGCGGGVLNRNGNILLRAVTVADNECIPATDGGTGGGIDGTDGTVLHESLVADNRVGANGEGPDCFPRLESLGYNLVANLRNCHFIGDRTGNLVNVDPQLGPLQRIGTTAVHPLPLTSIALDTGDPASLNITDQRGALRPRDGTCDFTARNDIGAYELQECTGATVYESTDRTRVVDPASDVGRATFSPFPHLPPAAPLLHYQVDDGSGFPGLILLVKEPPPGSGIRIHF